MQDTKKQSIQSEKSLFKKYYKKDLINLTLTNQQNDSYFFGKFGKVL